MRTGATPRMQATGTMGPSKAHQHNHPTYIHMIQKALAENKDRKGVSKLTILKYIMAKFDVGQDSNKVNNHLKQALRRGVGSGELKQVKGVGASGSFKIGEKGTSAKPKAAVGGTKPTLSPKKKAASSTAKKSKSPKAKAPAKAKKAPAKKTATVGAKKLSAIIAKPKVTARKAAAIKAAAPTSHSSKPTASKKKATTAAAAKKPAAKKSKSPAKKTAKKATAKKAPPATEEV